MNQSLQEMTSTKKEKEYDENKNKRLPKPPLFYFFVLSLSLYLYGFLCHGKIESRITPKTPMSINIHDGRISYGRNRIMVGML